MKWNNYYIFTVLMIVFLIVATSCNSPRVPGDDRKVEKWVADEANIYFYTCDERFGLLNYGELQIANINKRITCAFEKGGSTFEMYEYPNENVKILSNFDVYGNSISLDEKDVLITREDYENNNLLLEGRVKTHKDKVVIIINKNDQDKFGDHIEKLTFQKEIVNRGVEERESYITSFYMLPIGCGYEINNDQNASDQNEWKKWSQFEYGGNHYDVPVLTIDTDRKTFSIFFSDDYSHGLWGNYRGTYEISDDKYVLHDCEGYTFQFQMKDDRHLTFLENESDRMEFAASATIPKTNEIEYLLQVQDGAEFVERE